MAGVWFLLPTAFYRMGSRGSSVVHKADLSTPVVFYVFIDPVDFKMIERQFDITSVEVGRGRVL